MDSYIQHKEMLYNNEPKECHEAIYYASFMTIESLRLEEEEDFLSKVIQLITTIKKLEEECRPLHKKVSDDTVLLSKLIKKMYKILKNKLNNYFVEKKVPKELFEEEKLQELGYYFIQVTLE